MITAGAASKVINAALGAHIQGASVNQRVKSIRDDLEANALFLKDGKEAVLLISCDLAGLEAEHVVPCRNAVAAACGLDPRNVLIACTHTHSGPSIIPTNYVKPLEMEYLSRLQGWLAELAGDAVSSARPARIGRALGSAQVGYNRRCCWADGTHTMHGDTSRPDFTGLEGPDDPRHLALFVAGEHGKPFAVLYNNTSHPTSFYGADFLSADFPGAARSRLREALGPVPVLFLNGAFGDICMENQLAPSGEPREEKMERAACLVAEETLRLMHEVEFNDNIVLGHDYEDMEVPVRLPAPERLAEARELLRRFDAGEEVGAWEVMRAHGATLLQERFGSNPVDVVSIHALRIGDVAIVANPCELFCQFGFDIKRRSPAPLTAVASITDGCAGYCPTTAGIIGGGYSGEPMYWSRLAEDAGYRIVEAGVRLLYDLWRA